MYIISILSKIMRSLQKNKKVVEKKIFFKIGF